MAFLAGMWPFGVVEAIWAGIARPASRRVRVVSTETATKVACNERDLRGGDEILVRVGRKQAMVAKTPDFLEWAGPVSVPAAKRGTAWDEVLRQTRRAPRGEAALTAFLDTNVLIRHLTGDPPAMAQRATAALGGGGPLLLASGSRAGRVRLRAGVFLRGRAAAGCGVDAGGDRAVSATSRNISGHDGRADECACGGCHRHGASPSSPSLGRSPIPLQRRSRSASISGGTILIRPRNSVSWTVSPSNGSE